MTAASPSGVPTPPAVLAGLRAAFGAELIGETGYDLAATRCTSEEEKADARARGSSLLYGELLPDGVSKALLEKELGGALGQDSQVLELGMGSGKVALQIFLQCQSVRRVVGVEISRSRYGIAEAGLSRLVGADKGAISGTAASAINGAPALRIAAREDGLLRVVDTRKREIEFRCADFFKMGLNLLEESDAIFFAVQIPSKLFPQLCARLAKAKEGCRLFTYHALSSIWWSQEPCPFHVVESNRPEADMFATSWSPTGYKFHVYVCDRSRPPEVVADPMNELYSQWQPMWDENSKAYFYHNQETEVSQWEVPHEAGCWQAVWSEEHQCYFFFHEPSGHSQWEVPKCLANLGWTASS